MAIWCAIVALFQVCYGFLRNVSLFGTQTNATVLSFAFTVVCHCLTLLSSILIVLGYYFQLCRHNDRQNRDFVVTQSVANSKSSICCIVGGLCSLVIGILGITIFYGIYGSPNCYLGISVSSNHHYF